MLGRAGVVAAGLCARRGVPAPAPTTLAALRWPCSPSPTPVLAISSWRSLSDEESWVVPQPADHDLEFRFSRSSGAGGQNVNKVNTKVEIRFVVADAMWLDESTKQRLRTQFGNRINKEDELIVTSQAHRTQEQNRQDARNKLHHILSEATRPIKERQVRKGPTKEEKEARLRAKKLQSAKKAMRSKDWD